MIFCVLGPTASGKSDLAENLSLLLKAKIINFDAFQVYKTIKKGTAKPDERYLNSGRYFLYDFVPLDKNYDVSLYQKDCRKLLDEYKNENVILVGGTGLYLKSALYNYQFLEEDPMPKDYLEDKDNAYLYNKVLEFDYDDAIKIGPYNRKRLLRSIYIYETHNKTKTEINKDGKNNLLYSDVIFIGLDPDREWLYKNIDLRTNLMFENGLKEEVDVLVQKYGKEPRAFQAIGYKEFFLGLDDEMTKELIKKNTRNYAKRQMTFFKHQFSNVHRFPSIDEAYKYIKDEGYGN